MIYVIFLTMNRGALIINCVENELNNAKSEPDLSILVACLNC